MPKFTPMEEKQQRRAGTAGTYAGAGAGAYGTIKAGNGLARSRFAASGAKTGFRMQRGLGSNRTSSLASAVRTSVSGLKAKPLTRPSALGVATGALAGATAGSVGAIKRTQNKQLQKRPKPGASPVMKSDPFGIEKRTIPAERINSLVGGKFGRIPKPPKREYSRKLKLGIVAPVVGLEAGYVGSAIAGGLKHRKEINSNAAQIKSNSVTQAKYTREIKQKAISKRGKVYRITDMGTIAGKMKFHGDSMGWKDRRPKTKLTLGAKAGLAGGGAAGISAGAGMGKREVEGQRKTLARQNKKIASQRAILGKSSAFGIDHG